MSIEEHYNKVHGILFSDAKARAIDFKRTVIDWITMCRLEGGGVPMFRTGFAQRPFKSDSEFFVMGVCWLGSDLVQSQWFRGVPETDFNYMRQHHDDYIYLLNKFGKKDALEKVMQAPLVI